MLKSVKNTILDIIRQADLLLLALCTVTSLFGVVMIYSATRYQGGLKCVIIQLCGLALGIVLYFVVSMVDLTEISKKWQWLLAFNLGFFLLLKTPLGVSANGNLAWLGVRGIPIQVQPAEVVKLTFILLLARQLVWMKGRGDMKSIPAVGLLAGNLLVTIGLYYVISSDMGSALVYVCIFACMAFAAGVALRWFALGIFGAGAGFYLLWELDKIPPYMKERFQVLVDHSLYPLGAGWQQTRSLMAIGGGRLTGQGLLHGAQTQSTSSVNLPFRHTDFIFAVIGEELGMLGCVLTLALLTGGFHLDGLADTCDGIFSARRRERMLEIMRDSRLGTHGGLALIFVLLAKVLVVSELALRGTPMLAALAAACVAGRGTAVLLMYRHRYAREEGLGNVFIGKVTGRQTCVTLGLAAILAAVLLPGMRGVAALVVTMVAIFILGQLLKRTLGGQTGDTLGAAIELGELIFLLALL